MMIIEDTSYDERMLQQQNEKKLLAKLPTTYISHLYLGNWLS